MGKDSYYLKHDTNAAHDPKVEAMIQRYGMVGYGRYWRMAEILREQSDYRLPRMKWGLTSLAKAWECPEIEAEQFVKSLIDDFELIRSDGEFIWSNRILRDMDLLNHKREEAKRSAEASWNSRRNAAAMPTQSERNAEVGGNDEKCMPTQSGGNAIKAKLSEGNGSLGKERQGSNESDASPRPSASDNLGQSASSASPLPSAPFLTLLKNTLAQNSLLLRSDELDNCASKMIAAGVDSPAFLAWAVAKAATARIPSRWFVRGITEWDWIAKFKAEGAPALESKEQHVTHPELDTPPPPLNDDEAEGRRRFLLRHALDKRSKHSDIPFTDMELLLLAEHDAAHPPDPPPPVDDFDDDIPGVVHAEAQA